MPHGNKVDDYGVWVCTPDKFKMETDDMDRKTPHIHLYFSDNSNATNLKAAINVKSKGKESRLVFWVKRQFLHPIIDDLSRLDRGFYPLLSDTDGLSLDGLDYIRTPGLIFPSRGTLLEHDVPGPHNDMLNVMEPILTRAINENATVYIFGSRFQDIRKGDGIHEVHMNQGSLPQFSNDVKKDGALIIQFEDHWEAVFLAFGSQKVPTDDVEGLSLRKSESLAEQLGYDPVIPERTRLERTF